MRTLTGKLIASALAVSLLILPANVSAKERRGATLLVTRLDGSGVRGELIAVKPDSLVLLSTAGVDISVGVAEIGSVRIIRRSKAGKDALWGGVGGVLVGGVLGGLSGGIDEFTPTGAAVFLGLVFGVAGGLGGLGVGTLMGVDTTIAFAGEPDALARSRMEKLRVYSREYRLGGGRLRLEISPPPAPALRPPVPAPGTASTAPLPHRRAPRFRVRLPITVAINLGYHYDDSNRAQTTFRFLDGLPDPGPYPTELIRHPFKANSSGFDSASLGYELSEHWSAEVEFVFSHWGARGYDFGGDLRYTSTLDGITYEHGSEYIHYAMRFSAALFGLTYRQTAPTEFRRHIVEAGLAVGPAWAKFSADNLFWLFWQTDLPAGKVTLAARAHAAYDFYVIPNLSFGVAVGYRYFRADLPASTATATLNFWDAAEEYPSTFVERSTEVTIPPRRVDAGGFYLGARMGFRF